MVTFFEQKPGENQRQKRSAMYNAEINDLLLHQKNKEEEEVQPQVQLQAKKKHIRSCKKIVMEHIDPDGLQNNFLSKHSAVWYLMYALALNIEQSKFKEKLVVIYDAVFFLPYADEVGSKY
eukprot:6999722-Ditylum_brightwellii.AAC.1